MLVCPATITSSIRRHFGTRQAQLRLASEDHLVAFGIEATAPETGYGYLHRGPPLGAGYEVQSFVEKPDLATAWVSWRTVDTLGMAAFSLSRPEPTSMSWKSIDRKLLSRLQQPLKRA